MKLKRSTFNRIYELDQMIRSGRFRSAQTVADELGVSRRSVERDLEQLRFQLKADVVYDRKKQCYRYSGKPAQLPAGSFTERELAIMLIAERALKSLTGKPLRMEVHPLFNKLLCMAPGQKNLLERARNLCARVHFRPEYVPLSDVREQFETIAEAVLENRTVSFEYRKPHEKSSETRTVDPYLLLNEHGVWLLVGRCAKARAIREFRLSRMKNAVMLDHYFALPDDFKAKDYLDTGFGKMHGGTPVDVKLRITGALCEWVHENRIHHTQKVHTASDGDVILTMKTPLVPTLVGWILKAGGDAMVIGPEELNVMVREKAGALLKT